MNKAKLLNRIIKESIAYIKLIFRGNYYGFITIISSMSYKLLNNNKLQRYSGGVKKIISSLFENSYVVLFASGRMAFFSILKGLQLPLGSEVIVPGFTCSVMVNAILKAGCTPVFVDIDKDTLGSNPSTIEKAITPNTKVVVAQHSFGIPCKIDTIVDICHKSGIFVVEDCALSFLSTYKGRRLGLWGDAAIFSLDHSKPISTLIGGYLLTKNLSLYNQVSKIEEKAENLSEKHQKRILKQLKKEYFLLSKLHSYPLFKLYTLWESILKKKNKTFLVDDFCANSIRNTYPYPAKYPLILESIAKEEIEHYQEKQFYYRAILGYVLSKLLSKGIELPKAYYDRDNEIIPLRVVFVTKDMGIKQKISKRVDASWFWFKRPIEATGDSLEAFGYKLGSCPIAEEIGRTIVNIPVQGLTFKDIDKILSTI